MQEKNNKKPTKNQLKNFAVFSGIAIQMGVTIFLFVYLGKWLDGKYNNGEKLYLIIFTLLGLALSIYVVIKQLNRYQN
ncbi:MULTISPECIES: AtpZ/AtpI family protein [Galbibacter]|uniref:AtpZ/AtpI family protein n=1 Tax=Galbibacter pacificus TaxID=2996052 RepID=A0ABT6FU71_9FLAO|nr:AtpZ/AtpI family protein [Galbibacter pacificus]MDG3583333.1 AtpZ/AtpI family protein [Galbibacter pacificus]MDG3586814.1 AtpZ/AtpI family protein [Galbibacter pacificus]